MLDTQWANPMFAFFRYRLFCDESKENSLTLNRLHKGVLLHTALHALYSSYNTSAEIRGLIESENYIQKCLDEFENVIFLRSWKSRNSEFRVISRVSGHHFRAFRRAAAQKQILISGAKHSPLSLLLGGPLGQILGSNISCYIGTFK